jgi:hypothetical protein
MGPGRPYIDDKLTTHMIQCVAMIAHACTQPGLGWTSMLDGSHLFRIPDLNDAITNPIIYFDGALSPYQSSFVLCELFLVLRP